MSDETSIPAHKILRGHLVELSDHQAIVARLTAERDAAVAKFDGLQKFIDSVRDSARNRNPLGATILDFMACWNEQYEVRLAKLEAVAEAARRYVESPVGANPAGHDLDDALAALDAKETTCPNVNTNP